MMSFYKSVIGVHKFNGIREILLKKKSKQKRNPKKSHSLLIPKTYLFVMLLSIKSSS